MSVPFILALALQPLRQLSQLAVGLALELL